MPMGDLEMAVHPHLRGENTCPASPTNPSTGSSPPAWGKLVQSLQETQRLRFIPTCVGKIKFRIQSPLGTSVHPHLRGENSSIYKNPSEKLGSSPPAWGKLPVHGGSGRYHRFIPTCVGKMVQENYVHYIHPVHPHLRGENARDAASSLSGIGSSPPAWGKLTSNTLAMLLFRFIPTCVGKIATFRAIYPVDTVHPHLRGENGDSIFFSHFSLGSSPPAWGKLHLVHDNSL